MIGEREWQFGQSLVQLILGVNELYLSLMPAETEGLAREGYVAINLSRLDPFPMASYAAAQARTDELRRELANLDLAENRRQYFSDYLTSIDCFCRWRDTNDVAYPELVHSLMGIPGDPPELEPLADATDALLRDAGFSGDMFEMMGGFRRSRQVDPEKVVQSLTDYMVEARAWVVEHMFPLPDDFQFTVVGERGVAYNAYCAYVDRAVQINLDIPFTHEDLKHLACHEAYPGHSTQMQRHEQLVAANEMTEDGLLVVTDTPTTPLFEGIGEIGLTLLGWDQSQPERINRALGRLNSAVGCWAGYLFAQGRHQEGMDLMLRYGGEEWTTARARLLSMPIRLPFIYAYFYGDRLVHGVLERTADRGVFLTYLYALNHSPASFELFDS